MAKTILNVNNLKVNFKNRKGTTTAIEDVSFKIEEGSTLGVVGESGCGKSVTATSILRLLPKNTSEIAAGQIIFDNKDLVKLSEEEMRNIRGNKISMIFQEPMNSLNPVYKIGTQMTEMLTTHQKISKEEAREKNIEMLKKVGIPSPEQRLDEYPHQMSGGMLQRIMIAMALSANPALLIADEPTTALDVTIQAQILDLMAGLKKDLNTAIMMITHDMGVIAEVADYVMVMYAGQVVEYDSVENIFSNPMHPYTVGLLNSIPRADKDTDRLFTIEGTVPNIKDMPKGCRFYDRCGDRMDICKKKDAGLLELGDRRVRCWKYAEGLEDIANE